MEGSSRPSSTSSFKAVLQLLWPDKESRGVVLLGRKPRKDPWLSRISFERGTNRGQRCAAFFTESRMQFDGTTKLHRKSGFGLHQLRNRYSDDGVWSESGWA